MNAERRPTSARCFVYGDQRSVEHSLDALERFRDPHNPARTVRAVHLSGDPLAVIATASGVRDLERLHGQPFSFGLQIEPALGAVVAHGTADALHDLVGVATVAPERLDARGDVLLVCGADQLDDASAERLAAALDRHGRGLDVLMLTASPTLPARLRPLLAAPGREVVVSTLRNPLLEPAVEAFLAAREPARIVIAGRGVLLQMVLGATDFFVERRDAAADALDAVGIRDLGRQRVALLEGMAHDTALDADLTAAPVSADALLAAALDGLDLTAATPPVAPATAGVLVVPVVG